LHTLASRKVSLTLSELLSKSPVRRNGDVETGTKTNGKESVAKVLGNKIGVTVPGNKTGITVDHK